MLQATSRDIANQQLQEQQFIERRSKGPGAPQGSERLSDSKYYNPKLAAQIAKAKEARERQVAEAGQKRVSQARRKALLTQKYTGPSTLLADEGCYVHEIPQRFEGWTQDELDTEARIGIEDAQNSLRIHPPLDDKEIHAIGMLLVSNGLHLHDRGNILIAVQLLLEESIITRKAAVVPVAVDLELVEESNPFHFGTPEYEKFDRDAYHKEFSQEISPVFRAGAEAIGCAIDEVGMRRLLETFSRSGLELTAENVRWVGCKMWPDHAKLTDAEQVAIYEDRADRDLSSESLKQKYGSTVSFNPNAGRQAVKN